MSAPGRRRLLAYNGGLLRGRAARILDLAGLDVRLGLPGPATSWASGAARPRPSAATSWASGRARRSCAWRTRSCAPSCPRAGSGPPLGLLLHERGVHFDASAPSDLERLLATHPLDDSHLLARARDGIARMRRADLGKYSAHDLALEPPPPGHVLVVDQTRDDTAVRASGAGPARFREMLLLAREAHPGARIVVKGHPETVLGARPSHLGPADMIEGPTHLAAPVSPWRLLEGAVAVWTVSSGLGFKAIVMGHRPVVLGQPFYAGWGRTEDLNPVARRTRTLTRPQLFAGAMILYPRWYDPFHDRLGSFEDALGALEAAARVARGPPGLGRLRDAGLEAPAPPGLLRHGAPRRLRRRAPRRGLRRAGRAAPHGLGQPRRGPRRERRGRLLALAGPRRRPRAAALARG